jgi:hypothetical protein
VVEGLWVQDAHCREGGSDTFLAGGDASDDEAKTTRALVSLGTVRGRESCVEADPDRTITLFYRNNACRVGHRAFEEGARHVPSAFEPRCIVVLLAAESRAALRDEFLDVNRMLTYPLKINVSYVVATSDNPDLAATSTSCALGALLQDAHAGDMVGQDKRDVLTDAQATLVQKRQQLEVFERVYNGLPIYLPPRPPSSPPLPNAGPAADTLSERLERLRAEVVEAEGAVRRADAAIGVCRNTPSSPCGRPSLLAPDPWMGVDANNPDGEPEPCFGYRTHETIEGAFCGYWGQTVNVDAADAQTASQLLKPGGGPFCFTCGQDANEEGCLGKQPRILRCPVTAARTNRAGVWELTEWARLDRPYCTSELFARIELDNASVSEPACRAAMYERISNCKNGRCPQCISPCIYPTARVVANLARCTDPVRHSGFVHYYHTSDAGQLARSMHGAVRKTGYGPVPEKLTSHLYHIAHYNPQGYLQRDSVSCRAQHRNSPSARFVPGFAEDGMPLSRGGFMVPCNTHTDCMVCGRHPLTGNFYQCQKRYVLYDTVETGDRGSIRFLNNTGGASASFDIDLAQGAINNKTGICVDLDSSMNEGCGNDVMAAAKDGIVGCTDGFVGKFLCGLAIEVSHGDLSTAQITGDLAWPRTLIAGAPDADGDGRAVGAVTCADPIDCTQVRRATHQTPCAPPSN